MERGTAAASPDKRVRLVDNPADNVQQMFTLSPTQLETGAAALLANQRDGLTYSAYIRLRHVQSEQTDPPFAKAAIRQQLSRNFEQNGLGLLIEALYMRHLQIDQYHAFCAGTMHLT